MHSERLSCKLSFQCFIHACQSERIFRYGDKIKMRWYIFHPETRQRGIHRIIHYRNVSAAVYLPNASVTGTSTIHRWNGRNSNEHLIGRRAEQHSYQPIKGHIKIGSLTTTLSILNATSNTLASNVNTKQYAHSVATSDMFPLMSSV